MQTSRQPVHAILRRWIEEGRFGLDDKAPGPKPGVRKAGIRAVAAIKRLQRNELLGEFRVSAALCHARCRAHVGSPCVRSSRVIPSGQASACRR